MWLVIFLMVGFWVWLFNIAPLDEYEQKIKHILGEVSLPSAEQAIDSEDEEALVSQIPAAKDAKGCDLDSPIGGKKFLLGNNEHKQKLHSRFFAVNEHAFPILITFIEADTALPFGAAYVLPNKTNKIDLPVGAYQVEVQSGVDWCNASLGFNDGAYIQSDQTVQIKANQVVNLRVLPFGQAPSDIMLSFTNSLGMLSNGQKMQGTGSLILDRMAGGHYAVKGTINQLPVHFLVDTGATYVSVPESFAKRAGITECRPSLSSTANGVVKGCHAQADELTIGQFVIKNVTVSYHKGLPNDTFLLGMGVIGLFKMEHSGDVMKLTR